MCALTVLFVGLDVFLHGLGETQLGALDRLAETLGLVPFSAVGAVIVSRRAGNAIGWIFCAVGIGNAAAGFADGYALHALITEPGSLPGGIVMAWLATLINAPSLALLFLFIPLVFPDGQQPSRRWVPVAWLGVLLVGMYVFSAALGTGVLEASEIAVGDNPFGIESAQGFLDATGALSFIGFLLLVPVGVASLVVRFRGAGGEERQQLKWFLYAMCALVGVFAASILLVAVVPSATLPEWAIDLVFGVITLGLSVALGVAVLKYRLYEIDRIINRTLVYGPLAAVLALSYFAVVAGVSSFAGESELTVAAATLAVAALFQPLRRRVQAFIDRRFYRRKYDAARTLEVFSTHLRDEIDIESLTAELLSVVQLTMQPAHASLWLRAPEAKR